MASYSFVTGSHAFFLIIKLLLLTLLTFQLSYCVYLPQSFPSESRQVVQSADRDSAITQVLDRDAQEVPRALLIEDPEQALSSRLGLIDAAETSIDLQYFIWQNDYTGILLIEKLLQAADRGVQIRALIDDLRLVGLIDRAGALNQHPNIEIRIYNPFSIRLRFPFAVFQLAEFAIDGNRLNHRMHNKLLVADNQLGILGGRNVGDDYFGLSDDWYFIDTDILVNGPIVSELSRGFDVYWGSRWSYPVEALTRYSLLSYELDSVRSRIHERLDERPELAKRIEQAASEEILDQLLGSNQLDSHYVLVDDPNMGWFERPDNIAEELATLTTEIEKQIIIVTPYLVPTANLLDIGEQLIARGVSVKVLTNSLATNNHTSAHAAYTRFRRRILNMGIELYEFRPDARLTEKLGEATATMHSKYILFDDESVFIGSMNLDPRSLYLNTELGVMLQSRDLVAKFRRSFDEMINEENSYRLAASPEGIEWHAEGEVLTSEPANGNWQMLFFLLMQLLPLSSQL